MTLTIAIASQFTKIALGHLTREYPNKLDHVLHGPEDLAGPRALHPIFYGSFDWHSCVHGYWLLLHLYRSFPELPEAALVRQLVDTHITEANVATELAYLDRPSSRTFERPYGWAWLLKLAAELALHTSDEGRRWQTALAPLADAFANRFLEHLPKATYPIRAGTHANSAFAIALALEYAIATRHTALEQSLRAKALAWFAHDRDCPGWEPGGDDFLSPALIEVECMRRVLPKAELTRWLAAFLPDLANARPAALFTPAAVSDRTDGKLAHLDGVNLSRAWCFRGLATALPPGSVRELVLAAAETHLAASLPHVSGDYMGEHWLATYALLASSHEERR
jgi:hypothetical protein